MSYSAIETDVHKKLADDAGVKAILVDRIYPVVIPQNIRTSATSYPCAVVRRTGAERGATLRGNDGVVTAAVEITLVGPAYSTLKEAANAIRLALLNLAQAVSDHDIQGVHLEDESDEYFADVTLDGRTGAFGLTLRYAISYLEDMA